MDRLARIQGVIEGMKTSPFGFLYLPPANGVDSLIKYLSCANGESCRTVVIKRFDIERLEAREFLEEFACIECAYHELRKDDSQNIQKG